VTTPIFADPASLLLEDVPETSWLSSGTSDDFNRWLDYRSGYSSMDAYDADVGYSGPLSAYYRLMLGSIQYRVLDIGYMKPSFGYTVPEHFYRLVKQDEVVDFSLPATTTKAGFEANVLLFEAFVAAHSATPGVHRSRSGGTVGAYGSVAFAGDLSAVVTAGFGPMSLESYPLFVRFARTSIRAYADYTSSLNGVFITTTAELQQSAVDSTLSDLASSALLSTATASSLSGILDEMNRTARTYLSIRNAYHNPSSSTEELFHAGLLVSTVRSEQSAFYSASGRWTFAAFSDDGVISRDIDGVWILPPGYQVREIPHLTVANISFVLTAEWEKLKTYSVSSASVANEKFNNSDTIVSTISTGNVTHRLLHPENKDGAVVLVFASHFSDGERYTLPSHALAALVGTGESGYVTGLGIAPSSDKKFQRSETRKDVLVQNSYISTLPGTDFGDATGPSTAIDVDSSTPLWIPYPDPFFVKETDETFSAEENTMWVSIILAILTYLLSPNDTAKQRRNALLGAAAVGLGSYYVATNTEWGIANMNLLDGPVDATGLPPPDSSTIPGEGASTVPGGAGTATTGWWDSLTGWATDNLSGLAVGAATGAAATGGLSGILPLVLVGLGVYLLVK
jgi:hypothetical protein